MENTGELLFPNDVPQWYIAVAGSRVGPLTAAEIYERVTRQEVTWADLVWRPGQPEWMRICDVAAFQAFVPDVPPPIPAGPPASQAARRPNSPAVPPQAPAVPGTPGAKTQQPPPLKREEKVWFLYYNDSQAGPFAQGEVERLLKTGRVNGRVHIWKDGLPEWKRIEEVELFRGVAPAATSPAAAPAPGAAAKLAENNSPKKASEKRSSPRSPLLARILIAHQEGVAAAMCRDVSIGGMQVLTDQAPGAVGTKLRLNVSPVQDASAAARAPTFEPFTAEGVIVRLLEDQRGFSFRFEKLADAARRSLEAYIQSAE